MSDEHNGLSNLVTILELFNEKADKLLRSHFLKSALTELRISYSMETTPNGEVYKTEYHGPDSEATDAFVLTFRYFIQNNEKFPFLIWQMFILLL